MERDDTALRYAPGRMFEGQALATGGGSFARHESFHFRDGWLTKGIEAVREDPFIFGREDAVDDLGVGKNMVSAIRHWCQATGLIAEDSALREFPKSRVIGYRITPLGQAVQKHDPYIESDDTLWLLHLGIASNARRATVWYWAFNLFGHVQFNQESFLGQLRRYLAQEEIQEIAENSLEKDYSCFVRTYVRRANVSKHAGPEDSLDCPLAALDLVANVGTGRTFRFTSGARPSLRPIVFAYALYRYAELRHPGAATVSFESAQWDRLSPGRLLCLDGETLLSLLEALSARKMPGSVALSRTAGLNQVHLKSATACDLLERVYERP